MAKITRLFEGLTNGLNKLTIMLASLAIIAVVVCMVWFCNATKESTLSFSSNEEIDFTPTIVERMRSIGQWEFLSISDEELIDTVRTGFFTDDELVRIYYGTLSIGIDLRDCSKDWISTEGDTIFVTLPEVKLLDQNFIDEASSRSFFETGSWSNKDRKAMYERARQRMLSRCLTEENLNTARLNAREQIGRMLRPIAEPKVIRVK
ncbi:MAG: DUF4230 domain-containing protein [Prevotella sp.]|nr:DUF4230 domain-containing protein [Prevotella sp.]MCI6404468.1 DUF4230 domain-containing protein [Prevotella sp.]MCI6448209.1 DUF4230 domain-containing protein [Prevotella sp.]MCI6804308.1 DUF4230 domain-containing protein [Prevotella sp.]MCI7452461.1 DUF4230 domain-containing protein [Prevotella sp.]